MWLHEDIVNREFRKENMAKKRVRFLGIVCQPNQKRTMLHSSPVPSLSQEVTVGFPEEILTYPGGSGDVSESSSC